MKTLADCEKFVLESKLDFGSLTETDEYKIVSANTYGLAPFTTAYAGREFTLIGDLYRVSIVGIDYIRLTILYKIVNNEPYYATVFVRDADLKKKIRLEAMTFKQVSMRVRSTYGGRDFFDLVSIEYLDRELKFGRQVCTKCYHDYGFSNPAGYCDYCGRKVRPVFDFYSNEAFMKGFTEENSTRGGFEG